MFLILFAGLFVFYSFVGLFYFQAVQCDFSLNILQLDIFAWLVRWVLMTLIQIKFHIKKGHKYLPGFQFCSVVPLFKEHDSR